MMFSLIQGAPRLGNTAEFGMSPKAPTLTLPLAVAVAVALIATCEPYSFGVSCVHSLIQGTASGTITRTGEACAGEACAGEACAGEACAGLQSLRSRG